MNPLARAIMAVAGSSAPAPVVPVSGSICLLDARLGVTDVSGFASAWADQSGNGADAVQGTAGARPATGATLGGAAALDFDGAGDWLDLDLLQSASTSHTIFCVIDLDTVGVNQNIWDWATGRWALQVRSGTWQILDGSFRDTGAAAVTGAQVIAVRSTGTSTVIYRNNVQVGSTLTTTARALTGAVGLGGSNSGATTMNGRMAHFAAYASALGAGDMTQMQAYYAQEYGL